MKLPESYKKNSKKILCCLSILYCASLGFALSGCRNKKIIEDDPFKIPQEEELYIQKKRVLNDNWYTTICNIKITKSMPVIEILQSIASKLNIKLFFNDIEIDEDQYGNPNWNPNWNHNGNLNGNLNGNYNESKDVDKKTESEKIRSYNKIHPKINYSADNKPFIDVLIDIAKLCNLKLSIKGNNATLSADRHYFQIYNIPYLTGERKTNSDTSFSTSIMTSNAKDTFSTNSKAMINNTTHLNIFNELKSNLAMIIQTSKDPNVQVIINEQAGLLSIYAKQSLQREINKYIKALTQRVGIQILIEGKIFDIHLYKNFEIGVDILKGISNYLNNSKHAIQASSSDSGLSIGILNNNSSAESEIVKLLWNYGNVKSVANPRLLIANNNTGIFKVIKNEVFFKLKQATTTNMKMKNLTETNFSSEINTVPIGLIFSVQPSIDANGKIIISLRPTISEIEKTVSDPAVELMNKDSKIRSNIPVVQIRELDTVFTTEENKTVIIGGLLYTKKVTRTDNIPFLAGKFASLSDRHEIIILIKCRIIDNSVNLDYQLYLEQ